MTETEHTDVASTITETSATKDSRQIDVCRYPLRGRYGGRWYAAPEDKVKQRTRPEPPQRKCRPEVVPYIHKVSHNLKKVLNSSVQSLIAVVMCTGFLAATGIGLLVLLSYDSVEVYSTTKSPSLESEGPPSTPPITTATASTTTARKATTERKNTNTKKTTPTTMANNTTKKTTTTITAKTTTKNTKRETAAKTNTTTTTTITTMTTKKSTATTTAKPATTTMATTTATTTAKSTTTTTAKPTTTTTIKTTTTMTPLCTLPKKTILCTFGIGLRNYAVGPQKGLCDIIFWDFFYTTGRGTFLNRNSIGLQWFLEFAQNDSGATQFGIGIDHGNVLKAYNDLNDVAGISTFNDLWNMHIRHYGLLKLQVHDAFVTNRSTVQDYDTLFKRLRDLQEVSRAGDVRKYGCIILGVGLFAPRTGKVYDYLEELLRTAPIDAIIIRTHIEDRTLGKTCRITGPNVYLRSWNEYETPMVEALDYVQSRQAQFSRRLLMVSFSMAGIVFWVQPPKIDAKHFQLGANCTNIQIFGIGTMCLLKMSFRGSVVPDAHVVLSFNLSSTYSLAYDSPTTINAKICLSSKRYPDLQLGVALFGLELEDGAKFCLKEGYSLEEFAGYWRTGGVSSYMKNVTRDPNFLTKNPPCS